MTTDLPVGPPILVCDVGRQGAVRKGCSVAFFLCVSTPFGLFGAVGLLTAKGAAWVLVAGMVLGFLLCVMLAVRTVRFGHLNRVELYADRILVYDMRPRPYEFHFSTVGEIGWNAFDHYVYVNLKGFFATGHMIHSKHFANDEAARTFVARANEALRDYQRRALVV